ncbi:FAD-dependent oxidoreductase [Shewanella sp. YLB-07]|uniref:FAD-dependent oxidoreductase n=1 Tax=Shewanella sp. YLB-07 TaxID=2601268 RepID=UPI00128D5A49|nr:FAD-dependent oxidoreductase [Shewanella sp. YLB-07]MPY24549.1 FAD-binding oxidoreductase [Shewanella sp. YLB-07]
MKEIQVNVPGFRHDFALVKENRVNQNIGLVDCYRHLAPMVDTDVYMSWLMKQITTRKIPVIKRKVAGPLVAREFKLKKEFSADVIVNCTGLGATNLANDPMYSLRGAVINLVDNSKKIPKLMQAHCVSHDDITSENEIVFIIPRGTEKIVLGAIAEKDSIDTDIHLENYDPIKDMYRRCCEFLPELTKLNINAIDPIRVGLRPFRQDNVRLDREKGSSIVHSDGHGGAGFTFSWGCAEEVTYIVLAMLS